MTTHTGDFGSVIDEIHSGIGGVAESDVLVHEDLGGEGAQDLGLLGLRRVGLRGICGTAEGVVFRWVPATRVEGCGEGVDGEGEDGEEDCEMHLECGLNVGMG